MIKKIRKQTLIKRRLFFSIGLILWFFSIQILNTDNSNYQSGKHIQTLWILSGIVIAGLYAVFFPIKKKKDS